MQERELTTWPSLLLVQMTDLYVSGSDVHFQRFLRIPRKNDHRSNATRNSSIGAGILVVRSAILSDCPYLWSMDVCNEIVKRSARTSDSLEIIEKFSSRLAFLISAYSS